MVSLVNKSESPEKLRQQPIGRILVFDKIPEQKGRNSATSLFSLCKTLPPRCGQNPTRQRHSQPLHRRSRHWRSRAWRNRPPNDLAKAWLRAVLCRVTAPNRP
jgi:hypothetical protein